MNGDMVKLCATCNGTHVASDKHSLPMAADPGRVYYCAECWPEAAGLEALRQMAIASARRGALIAREDALVKVLSSVRAGRTTWAYVTDFATRLMDEIDAAGETAGKAGW